jgi:alpha-L-rhamnosidase
MKLLRLLLILWLLSSVLSAQENKIKENTNIWNDLSHAWKSWWISHPSASLLDYGVFHYRKSFELKEVPKSFLVHVSADNRYNLYVNGIFICEGPVKSDFLHWNYESVDIAPYLHSGANVIAARVYNLGIYRQPSQFTRYTAFILQGDLPEHYFVNTNDTWKVYEDKAYTPILITEQMAHGFYVTGPCDSLDAARYPWGWEQVKFDDSGWPQAKGFVQDRGTGRGYIHGTPWSLIKRTLPFMEQKKERIARIARCSGIKPDEAFLSGKKPLVIPENTNAVILLDNNTLTVGYPELLVSGGKSSRIKIVYGEALFDSKGVKGNRNQIDGKVISGAYDVFISDGEVSRIFRPLGLRTFRYIQLEVKTAAEPLFINDYYNIFTAFPLKENALFKCEPDTARLSEIWNTGWRTARLCANETYWDCPYYEQLQYVGDTRIQSLISLYVSGDDRLMRNALVQVNNSVIPEGLTFCRAPSQIQAIIPPFSLIWVSMVHDYHMHRDDSIFVRQFLPNIRSVLSWYEDRLQSNGLLGQLDWWQFMDWTDEFPNGVPPGAETGNSALISLTYAYTLQRASDLFRYYGYSYEAERYMERAGRIKKGVQLLCFDNQRKLFAETPDKKIFSQHTNIMAVLTEMLPAVQQQELLERIIADKSLINCSIYFKFYLMEALKKAGLGNLYISQLKVWQDMLDLGLSTFPETEPNSKSIVGARSDCHAWSASVCYDFLSIICGINPAEHGFKSVEINPHPGYLTHIKGVMPHPAGLIEVDLNFKDGHVDGMVSIPVNLKGWFIWNGKKVPLKTGKQEIKIQ